MSFLLYFLFFASALLLIVMILMQEGKGGGLGEAFGGAGAETFGVRAGGIMKVTFTLFAVFVLSALALHWTSGDSDSGSVLEDRLNQSVGAEGAPAGGATGAPPTGGGTGGTGGTGGDGN